MTTENTAGKAPSDADLDQLVADADTGGRQPTGMARRVLLGGALAWSLFQVWIASPLPFLDWPLVGSFGVFNDTEARSIHLAIAVFLVLGGHHLFLRAWFESFRLLPPWDFPAWTMAAPQLLDVAVDASARVFGMGLLLGGPPLVALVVTDVAFGLLNRAAPQVNVFMLSMPAKMFVGVAMALLVLPATVMLFEDHLGVMVTELTRVIAVLGG